MIPINIVCTPEDYTQIYMALICQGYAHRADGIPIADINHAIDVVRRALETIWDDLSAEEKEDMLIRIVGWDGLGNTDRTEE